MRLHPLHLALALACAGISAGRADEPPLPDADSTRALATITVTATLTERALDEIPNTVSVIDRGRIERELMSDIRDLVRYEPGVSVRASLGRFGLSDFRIRGLDGNRVLIETDGVSVSDAFSIGSFSASNRNFVDLETLKAVEILRGPGSSLYGSDALGGVVSFITRDPVDYLGSDGRGTYFGLRTGFDGADDGVFGSATAAIGNGRWSGLLVATRREGNEPDNHGDVGGEGSTRTRPNLQDSVDNSLLAKLLFEPNADQRFRLTLEGSEAETDTEVLSSLGVSAGFGNPVLIQSMSGVDLQTRARIALAHEVDAIGSDWFDSLRWQVYRQDSETTQDTFEQRSTLIEGQAVNPVLRAREFNFDQRVVGGEITLHKDLRLGEVAHTLTWGLDVSRTDIRQKRDGRATNLVAGSVTHIISPDVFPVRDFPVSQTTVAALYLQDEIDFADGAFRLVPGLRVDRYQLDPELDSIFAEDNPGVQPAEVRETRVSPKLGAVWQLTETWSATASYAEGFRSPPYNDVNLGFTNLQFGYTALPNPDLKPETSRGLELGLRAAGRAGNLSLSVFHNRYDDFIESLRSLGVDPETGLLVFQSQNIAEAEIRGVELKGELRLDTFSETLDDWRLRAALSHARGDDRTADQPLASVDPARAVIGIGYDGQRFGTELIGTFVRGKDRLPASDTPQFTPPGYALFDLLAHVQLGDHARIDAGIFNLADRSYWDWASTPLLQATAVNLDRYTQPGRHAAINLNLRW